MNRLIVASVAMLASVAADAFTMIENGKACPIAVPTEAEPSTLLAADEFAEYAEKVSGVRPLVVTGEVAGACVRIGTLDSLKDVPEDIRARLEASDSYESSVTKAEGGVYWIVGRESVAELYGTYRTLEDDLGIRWLKQWEPEDPGEYVPEVKGKGQGQGVVELADGFRYRAPKFKKRWITTTGCSCAYVPEKGVAWAYRIGLQSIPHTTGGKNLLYYLTAPALKKGDWSAGIKTREVWRPRLSLRQLSLGGGHMMFCAPFPAKKYFKDHPDWFAEVDGKRVPAERYCLSNRELQSKLAEHIVSCFDITKGKGSYLFGLMDGASGFCECAACRALDTEEERTKWELNHNITTRFNDLVKNVSRQVWEKYPEADLVDWAYSVYGVKAPAVLRHDPRMSGQFCIHSRCYAHALDDPKCVYNVQKQQWLKEWMQCFSQGSTYEYGNCSANNYAPYELTYAHDIKFYDKIGLNGWGEEMNFADGTPAFIQPSEKEKYRRFQEKPITNWQWFYVASRLTWDPSLDPQAILDEIEPKYYGEAYPAMKKYHALRRKVWAEDKTCMGYPRGNPKAATLLDAPGAKEELLRLLDEADRLVEKVKDEGQGQLRKKLLKVRVGRDRRWLQIYWIEPNEKMHAKAGRSLWAPLVEKAPSLDGRADDAAWQQACWTTNFLSGPMARVKASPPAPCAIRAGIVADRSDLYFFFDFAEPSPEKMKLRKQSGGSVYGDDSVELMLFPPSEANTYFQICVNAKGAMTCWEQPFGRPRTDLGIELKPVIGKDRWTLEMKVPSKKIFPLTKGDTWRVLIVRNRFVEDGYAQGRDGSCWTLDGAAHHTTTDYIPLEIGGTGPKKN